MPQTDKVEKLQLQPEIGAPDPYVAPSDAATSAADANNEAHIDKAGAASDNLVDQANNIIKNYVMGAMGISLVPIPLVDLFALTGLQIKMLHSLAKLYRIPFSRNIGKSLIASLVGGFMPTSSAMTLASLAKAVPGLGTATGVVSVSVLGGAMTYAIGSVFARHFEEGGTLLDFEPKQMRDYFASKLQEGKEVAAKLRNRKKSGA